MKGVDAAWVADSAVARMVGPGASSSPRRVVIDSRQAGPDDLFVGLSGSKVDGGRFAGDVIESGCWGVIVAEDWAEAALDAVERRQRTGGKAAAVIVAGDPLEALQRLAGEWRMHLGETGTTVVGITGSVGKTSTKDIARALLPGPVHASEQNLNTEIGLPLSLLAAEPGVRSVVLEMAMRGTGQIAELVMIAQPDVGAVINAGPVHTEILGSIEAVAAAKAELLTELRDGSLAIVPAEAGPLAPFVEHHAGRLRLIQFGQAGDVAAARINPVGGRDRTGMSVEVELSGLAAELATANDGPNAATFSFPFDSRHNLANALAAIAIGIALGGDLQEMAARAGDISFSRFRGELVRPGAGIELVNDCYNANPLSMRAALDQLGAASGRGRKIAVLGLMAELGPEAEAHHVAIGEYARKQAGVDLLIGVGGDARWYEPDELVADPIEAAELLASIAGEGDTVLVKGSRSVGLEAVAETLTVLLGEEAGRSGGDHV